MEDETSGEKSQSDLRDQTASDDLPLEFRSHEGKPTPEFKKADNTVDHGVTPQAKDLQLPLQPVSGS